MPMDLSMKSRRKLRLEEFLRQNLDEAPARRVIEWVDRAKGVFRILWTHQSSGAFTHDDAALFRYWALARGKPANLSSVELKQSLRMALNKSPSVERIDMTHDEYRYFRFTTWSSAESPSRSAPSATSKPYAFTPFKRACPSASPSSSPKGRKLQDSEDAFTLREPRPLLRELLTQPDPTPYDPYSFRKTVSPSASTSSSEDTSPWYSVGQDLPPRYAHETPTPYPVRDDPSPSDRHSSEMDDYHSRCVPTKDDPPQRSIALRTDLYEAVAPNDPYDFYPRGLSSDLALAEKHKHYDPWTSDAPYAVPSLGDCLPAGYDYYPSLYASSFPSIAPGFRADRSQVIGHYIMKLKGDGGAFTR
uniref:Interferon regulatory factor n=1 Tax=Penaeus japonicus TaxID=27405 RepID=A0A1L7NZP1_PENJP|nr:interferon regulatory factor [Penaeus japonicus]